MKPASPPANAISSGNPGNGALDVSFVKMTNNTERVNLRFSMDIFNLTNTPSFDIPIDDVNQNQNYNGFPVAGTPALPSSCDQSNTGFFNCAYGLGIVNKTIGSPRQIQFTLKLAF